MIENEDRRDKRGLFLGIVGVLTLIVAIIGASFAYFSLNARSNENAVTVKAATVQIVYEEGQNIAIENIIPSTREVAFKTISRVGESNSDGEAYVACVDDNNYNVCGTYDFTLTNNGTSPIEFKAYITPSELQGEVVDSENPENNKAAEKGFKNLMFVTFDRTGITEDNNNGVLVDSSNSSDNAGYNVIYTGNFGILNKTDVDATLTLNAGETKSYRLFIWLNEAGEDNDVEQGAVFKGTVHVDVTSAESGITGKAD